jgi:hypothetical protein
LRNSIGFEYDKGEYFDTNLSIDQMMQLSQEIADLAQKAKQEEEGND